MRETPLEMAHRHVAEAEQRLLRQEWRVGELELHGHSALLPTDHALLEQLYGLLLEYRRHLDYELAKPPRG